MCAHSSTDGTCANYLTNLLFYQALFPDSLLEELIRDVRDVNPKLDILGILITRHDGRKNVCKAMKAAIERRFGEKVFQTAITSSAKIQEAEASKRTIFQHDRQSN